MLNIVNIHDSLEYEDIYNPLIIHALVKGVLYFGHATTTHNNSSSEVRLPILSTYFAKLGNQTARNNYSICVCSHVDEFLIDTIISFPINCLQKTKLILIHTEEISAGVISKIKAKSQRFNNTKFLLYKQDNSDCKDWLSLPLAIGYYAENEDQCKFIFSNALASNFASINVDVNEDKVEQLLTAYGANIETVKNSIDIGTAESNTSLKLANETDHSVLQPFLIAAPYLSDLKIAKTKEILEKNVSEWLKNASESQLSFAIETRKALLNSSNFIKTKRVYANKTIEDLGELKKNLQNRITSTTTELKENKALINDLESNNKSIVDSTMLVELIENFPQKKSLSLIIASYIIFTLCGLLYTFNWNVMGSFIYCIIAISGFFIANKLTFDFHSKKIKSEAEKVKELYNANSLAQFELFEKKIEHKLIKENIYLLDENLAKVGAVINERMIEKASKNHHLIELERLHRKVITLAVELKGKSSFVNNKNGYQDVAIDFSPLKSKKENVVYSAINSVHNSNKATTLKELVQVNSF